VPTSRKKLWLEGGECNGSRCTKCRGPFHHECLFQHDGELYCSKCFKQNVVSQCSTETLFKDLFHNDDWPTSTESMPTHRSKELRLYIDNFLKDNILDMNLQEYEKWKTKAEDYEKETRNNMHRLKRKQKLERQQIIRLNGFTIANYEKKIDLARKEWLLSTDGVVKGLRYSKKENKFVAQLHYIQKGNILKEEIMTVTDDWVFDTYGIEIAQRIMDRGKHNEFITPVDENGKLVVVPMDTRKITRVKYVPEKTTEIEDDSGGKQMEICARGVWRGLLDDKSVCTVMEDKVSEYFGNDFVAQCKRLGTRKFIPIPVGNCHPSLMMIYPHLRCENAPPMGFMQGAFDTCILSSLASAFHHTGIPQLRWVAKLLHDQALKNFSGGIQGHLFVAKQIIEKEVIWLQPKRIPKNFDWENDINDYMFVVGVIQDNHSCCQHAVTIYRQWIYDSNEPYALPLCKENLDCCTWELKDGIINDASLFVRFCDGWIFQEQDTKKKKRLDRCVH